MEEGGKGSLSAGHKGLDYNDRTDDKYESPRSIKGKQNAKHDAAARQRRQGKEDIKQQQSELNENKKVVSQNTFLFKENKQLQSVKKDLIEENRKKQVTIQVLTERLGQVNLSNAKLLYTNQALTSTSLNERQKTKIVEAIAKAESVEDVKLISDTLQQTVGSSNKSEGPKSLNEVVKNKGGISFPRRETETSTNPAWVRMQKIAGIKK